MNNKAGTKYLSIWWFFMWTIIASGIILSVYAFVFSETSAKQAESDILANRIISCLIQSGNINSDFLKQDFNLFKNCSLSESIIRDENHFLRIRLYKYESCEKTASGLDCSSAIKTLPDYGQASFVEDCKIARVSKAKYFPNCKESFIYVLNGNEKQILQVLAGSNQNGKR